MCCEKYRKRRGANGFDISDGGLFRSCIYAPETKWLCPLRGCCRAVRVKKPSVSRAVKELSKSGHLVKNADGTLSLTETGLQLAEQIYEKHRFFTERLIAAGVDPKIAEKDACSIEHAVSAESFQKLKKAFNEG